MVSRPSYELTFAPPGSAEEHRQHVQRAADARAALRESELYSQASPEKEPQERIQIWERLHALRLPRALNHRLVGVIATQTGLTLGEVQNEQRRRAEVPVPSPVARSMEPVNPFDR